MVDIKAGKSVCLKSDQKLWKWSNTGLKITYKCSTVRTRNDARLGEFCNYETGESGCNDKLDLRCGFNAQQDNGNG